jgi:hypothetical protein
MFTVRADPDGVGAYHRYLGKRTSFTCILIYTGVKVITAYFMPDKPETPVSVGVDIAGRVHLSLICII